MDQPDEFKKKREEFSFTIRKNNREETLMKRRRIDHDESKGTDVKHTINEDVVIVDNNLRTALEKLLREEFSFENLDHLIDLTSSTNIYEKHRAIIGLRKLTAKMTDSIEDTILQRDVIRLLMPWCDQDEYLQLKIESLEFMCNIASYSKDGTKEMVRLKLIEFVGNALNHKNQDIVYQGIWLVGNLAADEVSYRDELLLLDSVKKILIFLENPQTKNKQITSVWALTNLARGRPPPQYERVKYVIPVIAESLKLKLIQNENMISDCLWTLASLSDGAKNRLQRVMETEVVPYIMKNYLLHPNLSVSIPAIRLIGSFTTGNNKYSNMILENDFLEYAYNMLDSEKLIVLKEVCWALSNITAGTDEHILQFMLRKDLIEKLLNLNKISAEMVKSEILWIFTNLERSDLEVGIPDFFKAIKITDMVGELISTSNDTKIIIDALNCLERILILGERCRKISTDKNIFVEEFLKKDYSNTLMDLQMNKTEAIYNWSSRILKRFFNVEEDSMNDS